MPLALRLSAAIFLLLAIAPPDYAQSPASTGPLRAAPPHMLDAGPFGKLALNGVLSGFGVWQSHPAPGDQGALADLSNGQLFLQKTTGTIQFYVQAGAYNFPALGAAFLSTADTIHDFYGPVPVAYLKLAPKGPFSFEAGKLTSPVGGEYSFTFENVDIERGLLWNQGNSITRAAQLNYSGKKLSTSLLWGDGFYSNRWNWLTGVATYAFSAANSLEFVAGGNLGRTEYSSTATPALQNNSSIYNIIYTHTAKKWMVEPYFQYTHVPRYPQIGVTRATSTQGEAVIGSYTLRHRMSLAGRLEYTSSSGSRSDGSVNLLYGPGSGAFSATMTPTYQKDVFFARGEISWVHAASLTPGDAFGPQNSDSSQLRGLIEAGFIF